MHTQMWEWEDPRPLPSARTVLLPPPQFPVVEGGTQPPQWESVHSLLGSGVDPSILTFLALYQKKKHAFMLNINILPQTTKYNSSSTAA